MYELPWDRTYIISYSDAWLCSFPLWPPLKTRVCAIHERGALWVCDLHTQSRGHKGKEHSHASLYDIIYVRGRNTCSRKILLKYVIFFVQSHLPNLLALFFHSAFKETEIMEINCIILTVRKKSESSFKSENHLRTTVNIKKYYLYYIIFTMVLLHLVQWQEKQQHWFLLFCNYCFILLYYNITFISNNTYKMSTLNV